jgi:hemerythrin
MTLMAWKEDYSVKIQTIDKQHQRLFDLINALYDASRAGKGRDVLGGVTDELIRYTQTHFRQEEEFLKSTNYSDFPAHKVQHEKFVAKVVEFRQKLASGQVVVSADILWFLRDWLTGHIMQTDKKYSTHLVSKGIR